MSAGKFCSNCGAPASPGSFCGQCGARVAKKSGVRLGCILAIVIPFVLVPVLGILTAIAVPSFINYQCRAKQSEVQVEMKAIQLAAESYYQKHESFPPTLEELGHGSTAHYDIRMTEVSDFRIKVEAREKDGKDVWTLFVSDNSSSLQNSVNACGYDRVATPPAPTRSVDCKKEQGRVEDELQRALQAATAFQTDRGFNPRTLKECGFVPQSDAYAFRIEPSDEGHLVIVAESNYGTDQWRAVATGMDVAIKHTHDGCN